MRRTFAERNPEAVLTIYDALRHSFDLWTTKVKRFAEASHWAMDDFEMILREFPEDASPFGLESPSHRKMVASVCAEQYAQKLVDKPARQEEVFAGFETLQRQLREVRG